jgi:hypothetical protein
VQATRLKPSSSLSVSKEAGVFVVLTTVHLDDEAFLMGVEVHNVWADRLLSSELNSRLQPALEFPPETTLSVRLIATEPAREFWAPGSDYRCPSYA